MEDVPYWIIDNKLIFKPDFNDELDNYYYMMSQHNELIFSNYNSLEGAIKTNNSYELGYYSKFNKKIILTDNITHLIFGYYFNQEVKLTKNITNVSFGEKFNKKIMFCKNVTLKIITK